MASLREQKKMLQRQQLMHSALQLFAQKGYDDTSIAEIAAAAQCAPRTFFLYFNSKTEIWPAALQGAADELRRALANRPSGQTTLDVFQVWALAMLDHHHSPNHDFQPHPTFITQQKFHLDALLQPILAEALAKELHLSGKVFTPRLIAAAATAILSTLDFERSTHEERLQYLDQAMIFLRSGMDNLAV